MVMRADVKVEKQHGSHAKYAAEQIDGVEGILLCDVTARGNAQTDTYTDASLLLNAMYPGSGSAVR